MIIRTKAFGALKTNCYILEQFTTSLIIDPGQGSGKWIQKTLSCQPLAILNTHGHYDHVFDNSVVKNALLLPIYIHPDDADLLINDDYKVGLQTSIPDVYFHDETEYELGPFRFKCIHLPGHTHGSTILDFGDYIFSGDFVMEKAVGRYNFHTSSKEKMFESLKKYKEYFSSKNRNPNTVVYPGHGKAFPLKTSLDVVNKWLTFF